MKKTLVILLILVLTLSVLLVGCGKEEVIEYETIPFSEYDLSQSVVLPDYYELLKDCKIAEVSVTQEDIDAAIKEVLETYTNEVEVKTGKVASGDKIKISYHGVLKEDGSAPDSMQSDSFEMTLGVTSMIEGFTEGIIGHSVGDKFDLDLKFPDNYSATALQGKEAVFTIEVLCKVEEVVADTFDDDFAKAHSTFTTAAKWKEYIEQSLLEQKTSEAESTLFSEMYDKIQEATEITILDEAVAKEKEFLINWAKNVATLYDLTWEEYIESVEAGSEEQFLEEMQSTAEKLVKQDMFTYALCQKEGLKMEKEEYQTYRDYILDQYGYTEALFEASYNITIDDYMHLYGYEESIYATAVMSQIYDNIQKNAESK